MKPEKMTDERLKELLYSITHTWSAKAAEELRAHIAALTAERDDSDRLARIRREELEKAERMLNARNEEIDALRERVQALERDVIEQDRVITNSAIARVGRDRQIEALELGLRAANRATVRIERILGEVQAVTTPLSTPGELVATTVERLARRLAAIRQRAGDMDALSKVGEVCAIMGSPRAEWDDAIHEDVRQRGDVGTVRDVAQGVARYVLGEDGAGADVERICEHDVAPCTTCHPPATPEPTTAEAFAAVRSEVEARARELRGIAPHGGRSLRAVSALSMLERRMGVMVTVIHNVAAFLDAEDYHDTANRLRAALTDAPPVFTLEEVGAALYEHLPTEHHRIAREDTRRVLASLTALRKG